jgi:hypothetical protein
VSLGSFSPRSRENPRPHDFVAMGLAPDGVSKVVVSIGNKKQVLPVRNNLYSASGDLPVIIRRLVRHQH